MSFNPIYEGKDLLGRARTGTGKTLAFALPIIERLLKTPKQKYPRVLVLTPTRELAKQVSDDFVSIGTSFKTICIYGGVPYETQRFALANGVDIVVGTPGRILDHIHRQYLILSDVQFFVMDEADQMLDIGFKDSMEEIINILSPNGKNKKTYQMLLFSATCPDWVHQTTNQYMSSDKVNVDLVKDEVQKTSVLIEHLAIQCPYFSKKEILRDINLMYSGKSGRTIIFVETKREANDLNLSNILNQECQTLHGDIPQSQRESTIKEFKKGTFKVLLATDVAARGLDISNVEVIINYDPPRDSDTYVHRSGRTGRAGKKGVCITFFKPEQKYLIEQIQKKTGTSIRIITAPQPEDIIKVVSLEIKKTLDSVSPKILPYFEESAQELIDTKGALWSLTAALALISGYSELKRRSILNFVEGRTTLILECRKGIQNIGYIKSVLKTQLGKEIIQNVNEVRISPNNKVAVFDVSDQNYEIIKKSWKNSDECSIQRLTELPEFVTRQNNFQKPKTNYINATQWQRKNRGFKY